MSAFVVGGNNASTISIEEVTGWHVLTIEQYTRTRKLASGEYLSSATFIAAGHRWSMKYYPSAPTAGSISIGVQLVRTRAAVVKAGFVMSLLDFKGDPVPEHTHRSREMGNFFVGTSVTYRFPREAVEQYALGGHDSFKVRCDITVLKRVNRGGGRGRCAADAVQFIVVPPSDMARHIGDVLSNEETADVTLEVVDDDGETTTTFAAHRNILAARSPVFKALLFGPMRETTDNDAACRRLRIEGVEARVFKAFLHFVYNDSLPAEIKKEEEEGEAMAMAQHLLVAADRYGMERMKLVCENMLCDFIDVDSVGTMLTLAEQHGCRGLKRACLEFLVSGNNLKEAMKTDGFDHLTKSCPSFVVELLVKLAL